MRRKGNEVVNEVHHHAGNVIFREGDASRHVGYVLSGRVEILKRINSHEISLGEVGAGEYVGEMGVLEGRPREATVRAKTDVRVRLLAQEEFTDRLGQEPDVALQLLIRLSGRLRASNERLVEVSARKGSLSPGATPSGETAEEEPVPADADLPAGMLRLFPASPALMDALPSDGLKIQKLPFHVGRSPGRREKPSSIVLGLSLRDHKPFRLSRAHFAIVRQGNGFAVRDVKSHLGTVVNGQLIGQHAPRATALLDPGSNDIAAGGSQSPFAFRLVVASD